MPAELIMAVGLVVDYMVHVVHYFLNQVKRVLQYGPGRGSRT